MCGGVAVVAVEKVCFQKDPLLAAHKLTYCAIARQTRYDDVFIMDDFNIAVESVINGF